ncbi:MAG: VWA domain-containing protein [Blastocatellia bacterium]
MNAAGKKQTAKGKGLRLFAFVFMIVLFGATLPLRAQTPKPKPKSPAPKSDEAAIIVETSEVLLPVTVRDAAGQFAPDMKAEDFMIYEDGIAQPISSFAVKRMPVHVVLLIDTSDSVTHELDDFKAAALRFVTQLDPEDKICLIQFDDKVKLVLDWTSSRNAIKRALNLLQPGFFTKFNDALYLAAKEQLGKLAGRKAVIVLTDGIDSGRGSITPERAFRTLVEEEVPVYSVSKTRIQGRADRDKLEFYQQASSSSFNQLKIEDLKMSLQQLEESEKYLTRISEETGGRIFLPENFDDLSDAYQKVADELRSQYVIFYTPANPARDGEYRSIRVKIKQTGYRATTRFGYYPK